VEQGDEKGLEHALENLSDVWTNYHGLDGIRQALVKAGAKDLTTKYSAKDVADYLVNDYGAGLQNAENKQTNAEATGSTYSQEAWDQIKSDNTGNAGARSWNNTASARGTNDSITTTDNDFSFGPNSKAYKGSVNATQARSMLGYLGREGYISDEEAMQLDDTTATTFTSNIAAAYYDSGTKQSFDKWISSDEGKSAIDSYTSSYGSSDTSQNGGEITLSWKDGSGEYIYSQYNAYSSKMDRDTGTAR
jgi:hypothetical protein